MCFSLPFPKADNNGPLISLGCVSVVSNNTLGSFPERLATEMDRTNSPLWLAFQMSMSITPAYSYRLRPEEKAVLQMDQAWIPSLPGIFKHWWQVLRELFS